MAHRGWLLVSASDQDVAARIDSAVPACFARRDSIFRGTAETDPS